MTEASEQDLIQAIRNNPTDRVSRKAYADCLERNGASNRAALIRVCLDLDNPAQENVAELQAEYSRLQPLCHQEWEAAFRSLGAHEVHLENGYPFSIIIPVEQFVKNGQSLLKAAPFESLCPAIREGAEGQDMQELARSSDLAQLPELNLGHRFIGDQGLSILVKSPHLGNLKTLKLPYNNIGDQGVQSLIQRRWDKLVCLDLGMNPIGVRGLRSLAESSSFPPEMRIRLNNFDGAFSELQKRERQTGAHGDSRSR